MTHRTIRAAVLVGAVSAALLASPPLAERPGCAYAGEDRAARAEDDAGLVAEATDRRRRAAERIGADAALLVLTASPGQGLAPAGRNADFEYLSPVTAREAALLLAPERAPRGQGGSAAPPPEEAPESRVDRIYLAPRNPAAERWTGPEAGPGAETAGRLGFDEARALDRLADDVAALLRSRTTLWVSVGPQAQDAFVRLVASVRDRLRGRWVRLTDVPGAGREDLAASLTKALPERWDGGADVLGALARFPAVDVRSARPHLAALREVKSPSEIAKIRRAVDATVAGMRDALRAARPGGTEYELAAIVELRCRLAGCARQAFPSIAGSGPNSCVLHYDRNTRTLADGDLVVLDVGGEFAGYAADVTRTFPVSGRFTGAQAKVYDAVLEAQTAALAAVRPGVTMRQIHGVAVRVLERHGLQRFFLHGTCHSVGLEVHDAWRDAEPLRAGAVITVEPGVYDAERSIGVRIEDTVLVTETGCEVLSSGIPKTRDALEALLREDPPEGLLGR